ncbi:hypothetical protein Agub_g7198 [Astrephomene gubernaculifera]|uniref:Uncharacterized protein n=1 Tax=Astrephomene gubernaculifera TaxID=47775 RepID=A0AAD3DRG6_9CHLO|nr:hypothetical protein Agub_g7198 [Astrephomene gubernaculifera]
MTSLPKFGGLTRTSAQKGACQGVPSLSRLSACRPHHRRVATAAAMGDDGGLLFLNNGEVLAFPKKRAQLGPCFELSCEDALRVQLEALQRNNVPYADHGVEVLYRFANFDPFTRANYFGRSLDLGQFERFRRVMHSPAYSTLLDHSGWQLLSALQVDEGTWCARVLVYDTHRLEERTYDITMMQRLGGCYDGYWYTDKWVCEGQDVRSLWAQ